MMNKELKPCPFCDGKGAIHQESRFVSPFEPYMVVCEKCGSSSGYGEEQEVAIEKWNKRVTDEINPK